MAFMVGKRDEESFAVGLFRRGPPTELARRNSPTDNLFNCSAVCQKLGRNSIAIELDPDYVKLIEDRLKKDGKEW